MFLDLREVQERDVAIDTRLELPDVTDEAGGALLAGPAHLCATARPGKLGVELRGRVEAQVRLSCSRCLEPYLVPIRTDFLLNAVAQDPLEPEDDIGAEGEDESLVRAPGGRLDLARVASEQIYLELPLKPLCADSCAGLCATCGANRNRLECGCRQEPSDPRLAGLEELRRRLGKP